MSLSKPSDTIRASDDNEIEAARFPLGQLHVRGHAFTNQEPCKLGQFGGGTFIARSVQTVLSYSSKLAQ